MTKLLVLTVQLKKTVAEFVSSNLNKNVTASIAVLLIDSFILGCGAAADKLTKKCPEFRSRNRTGGPMGSSGRSLLGCWSECNKE